MSVNVDDIELYLSNGVTLDSQLVFFRPPLYCSAFLDLDALVAACQEDRKVLLRSLKSHLGCKMLRKLMKTGASFIPSTASIPKKNPCLAKTWMVWVTSASLRSVLVGFMKLMVGRRVQYMMPTVPVSFLQQKWPGVMSDFVGDRWNRNRKKGNTSKKTGRKTRKTSRTLVLM